MSRNKSTKSIMNDKEYLINKSKSFCMLPWVHVYTTPSGEAGPCCIAKNPRDKFGRHIPIANSTKDNMMEIVNSDGMKKLRVDMLSDVKNPICETCHAQEDLNIVSSRISYNHQFVKYFDESMSATTEDGSLSEFKMRYFDIRFSNICNFKCRTCGPAFSSQWEQENIRNGIYQHPIVKNDRKEFLQETLDQIPNLEKAYFAGGEPLITEEHYIMLEEMIRQGRTDITLMYNTNLSNLKFKDKDLMSLWKHFTNNIMIYASVDHYGERAEYIRSGTNWTTVEENFLLVKKSSNINLQMNTVLSLYNYKTFLEFYEYLYDKNLYTKDDYTYSVYNMNSPEHLSSNILPQHHKEEGKLKILKLLEIIKEKQPNFQKIKTVKSIIDWTMAPSRHGWDNYKNLFRGVTTQRDNMRGESFVKTFPELADLMED